MMTLGSVSSRLRKYEKISLNKRPSSHDGIKDLNEIPTYMYISVQKMSLERFIDQITCKCICNLISLEKSCPSSCIHQKRGRSTYGAYARISLFTYSERTVEEQA